MQRRSFLGLLAAAIGSLTNSQTTNSRRSGDFDMGDDYIQTFDEEGRLKNRLTSSPSFAGGGGGGSSTIDSYPSIEDVPGDLPAGRIVYVEDEGAHYMETGD